MKSKKTLTHALNTVSADKNVPLCRGAVLEEDTHAVVIVLDLCNPLAPLDREIDRQPLPQATSLRTNDWKLG